MPSTGSVTVKFMFARNAGTPDVNNPKLRVAGQYTPAHTSADGKGVSARFTSSFAINNRGYQNAQGVAIPGDVDFFNLTAGNGKNAEEGRGMADRFARMMSLGMEICCECRIKPYQSKQYDNGILVVRPDGSPIMKEGYNFIVLAKDFYPVNESEKHINGEIQLYNTSQGQQGRPPGWNIPGTPEAGIWDKIKTAKNTAIYQHGMTTFGYAQVVMPKNAQPAVYPNQPAPQLAPQGTVPLVEGYTYEQWAARNPNFDEVALKNPKFMDFHAMIQAKIVGGNLVTPTMTPGPTVVNTPPAQAAFNAPY